ncbi:Golgi pH regulator B [Schistosoma haematobium]|uniref:Golgi pH regulator B n=1 Tax=Schistosoma haematobium TaxID=6185 RepID=A0A922IMY1_SCHHA|nr:Golgi pH regulator B [Schistosoma haematobium]KAH9583207.1 Golgi pH regulator B [Schistosoma haematobium]
MFLCEFQRTTNEKSNTFWNMLRTVGMSISSPRIDEKLLKHEISVLEDLSRQLFLELHYLRTAQERIEFSKTWKGKYFNCLGYFFCGYCCWKIFISIVNILLNRFGGQDPITRFMGITIHYLGFQIDVKFWSQQISFWLVGIIVVTSIRGLLITLTKFFHAIASTKSSNIIVLIIAQIMGTYFVSSVLLLRMNMTAEYRNMLNQVLGDLQFHFYHRWFDVIFLISAMCSIAFLYLAHKRVAEIKDDYIS